MCKIPVGLGIVLWNIAVGLGMVPLISSQKLITNAQLKKTLCWLDLTGPGQMKENVVNLSEHSLI